MSLQDHPRAYGAVALTVAFAAGVLVTLGFKDLYPDLERRFQDGVVQHRRQRKAAARRRTSSGSSHGGERPLQWRRLSSFDERGGVILEDHEADQVASSRISDGSAARVTSAAGAPLSNMPLVAPAPPPVADGLADCIGNTPLVRLGSLSEATGCDILAKAELLNPGGSPKDRVALGVIRGAEARGLLVPYRGDTIYEGTVGSTGISLATLARALGYRAHICMPDDQSREKSDLLREMGAVVERVPVAPIVDPGHFVNRARRLAAEHARTHSDGSHGFFADQFETPANAEAHRRTTGPEILRQTTAYATSVSGEHGKHGNNGLDARQGRAIDRPAPLAAFVCGAGTAGTLTGVARYLKEDAGLHAAVHVVAADPQGSGLFNLVRNGVLYAATEKEGTRRRSQVDSIVEGVGMNRMTATLDAGLHLIDDAVTVTDAQACRMARWLVEHEGVFAGSSTAVNCVAAVATALTLPRGSCVVTLLCDSGQRHLSKFYKKVDAMASSPANPTETPSNDDSHSDNLLGLLGLSPRATE